MTRWQLIWRNFRLALRRSGKDERAQKWLIGTGSGVLIWVGYALYCVRAYRETGPWGVVFEAGMLGPGFGVALMIQRKHRQDDAAVFRLSLVQPPPEPEYAACRRKLAETLLRTAVMVDRAAAEAVHGAGQMAAEHVGGLRRRSLELARRPALWSGYSEAEKNLLMDAEGSWAPETTSEWLGRVEDVRVLRWVLGLDEVLAPFELLEPGLRPAYTTTQLPEVTKCLPPWDLRPAQSVAEAMGNRCVAEGFLRGMFTDEDGAVRAEFVRVAERMREWKHEDLLIGAKTVGEACDDEIRSMGQVAHRRLTVLTAVIAYLNGLPEAELRIDELAHS